MGGIDDRATRARDGAHGDAERWRSHTRGRRGARADGHARERAQGVQTRRKLMDRRDFVRFGAVAGTLALTGEPLGAEGMGSAGSGAAPTKVAAFELEETTVADLQAA